MEKKDIKNFSLEEMSELMKDFGLEKYRSQQMIKWLYQKSVKSFSEMTNFKLELREAFAEKYYISEINCAAKEISKDGSSKYLLTLEDGNSIESVIIPANDRITLCISSQVGCQMGCKFCLTAKQGYVRNLTTAEILNQVLFVRDTIYPTRITNIVFMGMGEPLLNLDNVIKTIEILNYDNAFGFSSRRITVSTCGIVPKLEELCERSDAAIAVSLNAPDNETRVKIMPITKKYPLKELIDMCKTLPIKKRERITFEYVLISGVNDSLEHAKKLTKLIAGMKCKINLIPFNECEELEFKTPSAETVRAFQSHLLSKDFPAILRTSRGSDISAACGQLKGKVISNQT